ncbi:MAG: hypothetical protein U0235_34255 [Polyangiaceae bacterium]
MILAFGFIFELPLFIGFLAFAGIVTPQQLVVQPLGHHPLVRRGRGREPGPEVMSQLIVSGILVGLYFVSIGVSFIVARKKPSPAEE